MSNDVFTPGAAKRAWFNMAFDAAQESADLYIYDDIGMFGIRATDLVEQVNTVGAKSLNVYINSYGGEVDEGVAIYNFLNRFAGQVTVHIDGIAASIASIIAMAGDRVIMPKSAMMFVHNPWTIVAGSATDLQKEADNLNKRRDALAAIYADKTGMELSAITKLMDDETLMSADEAVAMKFADATADEPTTANAHNAALYNRVLCAMALKMATKEKASMEQPPAETSAKVAPVIEPVAEVAPVVEPVAEVPPVEAEKPAVEVDSLVIARAELARYTERFGSTRAAAYIAEGVSFADAEARYVKELEAENAELKKPQPLAAVAPVSVKPLSAPPAGPATWKEALAACSNDYVKARKEHNNLYEKYMKEGKQ